MSHMHSAKLSHILSLLESAPAGLASLPGEVFSSGASTISAGTLYVVGLNPGGGAAYPSLREHVRSWNLNDFSAYTDQCWDHECWNRDCYALQTGANCTHARGTDPHQLAVVRAIQRLRPGLHPRDVFATNAVFAKSVSAETFSNETGVTLKRAFDACWPIHQFLLSEVQPRLILSLGFAEGASAYSFFSRKAHPLAPELAHYEKGRRFASFKWAPMRFDLPTGSLTCLVVGLRHPSYVTDAADSPEFQALVNSYPAGTMDAA